MKFWRLLKGLNKRLNIVDLDDTQNMVVSIQKNSKRQILH